MTTDKYEVRPIGQVRSTRGEFCLALDKQYGPALRGLEGFSHVQVLWWCQLTDDPAYREMLECGQPYKAGPARMGILATRSPLRPNPIGLSAVAVTRIDLAAAQVYVAWIDAEDGTPILDLKPYYPASDRVRDITVPEWCRHWPAWVEDSATFDWAAEFVNAR